MKLCPITILLLLLITHTSSNCHGQNVAWSYLPLEPGMITIDQKDRTEASVIYNESGLSDFENLYGISVTISPNLFSTNLVIVVFTQPSIGVENIAQCKHGLQMGYCIDLYDTGIQFEMASPPSGKYWVNAHILQVDRMVGDGQLFIRFPRALSRKDFGKE